MIKAGDAAKALCRAFRGIAKAAAEFEKACGKMDKTFKYKRIKCLDCKYFKKYYKTPAPIVPKKIHSPFCSKWNAFIGAAINCKSCHSFERTWWKFWVKAGK